MNGLTALGIAGGTVLVLALVALVVVRYGSRPPRNVSLEEALARARAIQEGLGSSVPPPVVAGSRLPHVRRALDAAPSADEKEPELSGQDAPARRGAVSRRTRPTRSGPGVDGRSP